eukprot:Rmarinus@m.17470
MNCYLVYMGGILILIYFNEFSGLVKTNASEDLKHVVVDRRYIYTYVRNMTEYCMTESQTVLAVDSGSEFKRFVCLFLILLYCCAYQSRYAGVMERYYIVIRFI